MGRSVYNDLYYKRERERESKREKEIDRQTYGRQTDKQTDRQTDTDILDKKVIESKGQKKCEKKIIEDSM